MKETNNLFAKFEDHQIVDEELHANGGGRGCYAFCGTVGWLFGDDMDGIMECVAGCEMA